MCAVYSSDILFISHMDIKSWKPAYHITFPSSYFRMLPPEVYALPHFSKSLVLTSDLVRALFVCLHPPYGTQFPKAFVLANLWQRFGNVSKHFIFNWHFLPPLATYYWDSTCWCWRFINLLTYLLILAISDYDMHGETESEDRATILLSISSSSIESFSKFFHLYTQKKCAIKWIIQVPPQFKRVATLSCEIWVFKLDVWSSFCLYSICDMTINATECLVRNFVFKLRLKCIKRLCTFSCLFDVFWMLFFWLLFHLIGRLSCNIHYREEV